MVCSPVNPFGGIGRTRSVVKLGVLVSLVMIDLNFQ